MIYPQDFEQKIGFSEIRKLLLRHCLSDLGREVAERIQFGTELSQIHTALLRIEEMQTALSDGDIPIQYVFDMRQSLGSLRPEGMFITLDSAFDLHRSLETIHSIAQHLRSKQSDIANEENTPKYPTLCELTADLHDTRELRRSLGRILTPTGEMKDNASPELARIRSGLLRAHRAIQEKLNAVLRSAKAAGIVSAEATTALRDGHHVIPVAPEYKRKLRGIIHDESATGKTVFIEPIEVVEVNNRFRELEIEERREITAILKQLSDAIRPDIDALLHNYAFLAQIDYTRAAALLANELNAIRPSIILPKPALDWHKAYHPLLTRNAGTQTIVPLDITLTNEQSILLVSGPNAGGKSVCLKTAGLLQYMLQCGLPIPVAPHSIAGLFSSILIDIGDDQSIENELSTYAAHLTNMKIMLRNADARSLILIDEFGGGTEPQIGGAIAEAILDRLLTHNHAWGVITTHYQNLKLYAEQHDGIANGAMMYDRHRMQPLYTLTIGTAGSSFALEIARKTGLPTEIISTASEIVGQDYVNIDKYVQDIVRDKRYWAEKRKQIREQEKKRKDLIEKYQQRIEKLKAEQATIVNTARTEAEQLISQANAEIERVIRTIKETNANKEATQKARRTLANFTKAQIAPKPAETAKPKPSKIETATALSVGSYVKLEGQSGVGEVEKLTGKNAVVIFGQMRITVARKRLQATDQKPASPPRMEAVRGDTPLHERRLNFNTSIDIRGMYGDEAIARVVDFIDDAVHFNMSRVRILHGTGNGILRNLVRTYLATQPNVSSFADEHIQMGGAGITVIDLS